MNSSFSPVEQSNQEQVIPQPFNQPAKQHHLIKWLTVLIFITLLSSGGIYLALKFQKNNKQQAITGNLPTPASSIQNSGLKEQALDKFSLWTKGTILRGANIYQRHVYNELDGAEFMGSGPLGPPLSQEDFNNLSRAGANLVVLSHPGLFDEKPPYVLNESVQDNLDRLINMANKANLFVIIVARTGPGRSEFTLHREEAGTWFSKSYINDEIWKEKAPQDAYINMWKYTAQRYHDNPIVIGYELMVEPNSQDLLGIDDPTRFYPAYENSTYDWNVLASQISSVIRQVDKDTPILIGGLGYSGVRWLPFVKPTGDRKTVYIVHQYEPQTQYTHQSEDGKAPLINSYPGKFDVNGDGIVRDFDKTWIDNLLTAVDNFKNANDVPIAVTEYGVVRWEPGAEAFMNDEMELFEKRGMNYAIWEWSTSYKPSTNENNAFNFRFGPDKNNKTDTGSKLYDTIKKYWQKNIVRPSNYRYNFYHPEVTKINQQE